MDDTTDEDLAMLKARFQREGKIAKGLASEHIAKVLYAGRTQSDELFIAFEYLEGETLAERLRREAAIDMPNLAWIVDDVLEGLGVAHEAGIVHRDIKPGNIFLERMPRRAKILDFGIAKQAPGANATTRSGALTALGVPIGTSTFMAPEQVTGAALVDARADIYSLGVVVFQCLTGKLPFAIGRSPIISKRQSDALSLADVTGVTWPMETERFLRRALERDPGERFPDATSARDAWLACRAVAHPSVRPDAAGEGATEDGVTTPE
jgi:serine/threonine protein kinase